jgi:hypothetical protein
MVPSLFFSRSSSRRRCFAAANFFNLGGKVFFIGSIRAAPYNVSYGSNPFLLLYDRAL